MPADGFFGFFGLAPAYCASAASAPPMSTSNAPPNAPLQSVMIAILIGVAADLAETDVVATAVTAIAIAPTPSGSASFHPRNLLFNPQPSSLGLPESGP